jgi:methionine-rich copper-binding protein CopC
MTTRSTRVRSLAFLATAAVFLLLPAAVAAHAELDVATPADGATVEGQPAEVAGTYTQEVNPDGSSLVLRDAANAVVARGGVDPDDDHRMVITDLPDLAPGEYLVQSVTISAEDDELDRATWSFTVEAAPTPEPTPTPAPTVAPSATPTASPTPEPTPSISPTPSGPPQDPTGSTADVVLPIIAGLAIVLVAAGLLLSRRNRPSGHA